MLSKTINIYKVSIIYGAKLILVSENLFHHIKLYIRYLRPILIDDKHRLDRERYLFVSSKSDAAGAKAVQLQHNTLRWCLTATCERLGVLENMKEGAQKRMNASRIRFSVITELVYMGEDSPDNIAYCFGKHTKEVCKKFYVQFWSNREAARLSWKVHKMYNSEKDTKAIQLREEILEDKKIPDANNIKRWITNRINKLKLSGTDVEDQGLMNLVKRFRDELHFHRTNG